MCPAVPMARVLLPMLPKSICAPPLAIFASAGRHQQPQPDQLTEMFPGHGMRLGMMLRLR
jgi:hypothetical protein